jgi:hypothetical protein
VAMTDQGGYLACLPTDRRRFTLLLEKVRVTHGFLDFFTNGRGSVFQQHFKLPRQKCELDHKTLKSVFFISLFSKAYL